MQESSSLNKLFLVNPGVRNEIHRSAELLVSDWIGEARMEKPLTNCPLIGHCLRLQKHPEGAMFGGFPELGMAKESRGDG